MIMQGLFGFLRRLKNQKLNSGSSRRRQIAAPLEIDVTDRYGNRPVRIRFDLSGIIKASNGSKETVVTSI